MYYKFVVNYYDYSEKQVLDFRSRGTNSKVPAAVRGPPEDHQRGQGEEEADHHIGAERGGGGPRTLALPLQHRPLPRRETHHLRSGRR